MKLLLLPVLIIALTGCLATNPPSVPTIEVTKKINVPPELLIECPMLVSTKPKRMEELLYEDLQFIHLYYDCRLRYSKLINSVKEITK